jgi:hypothetical protein
MPGKGKRIVIYNSFEESEQDMTIKKDKEQITKLIRFEWPIF